MNVLIAGYEAAPFYKRGGLGDVMESLPKALLGVGVDVKVVIPYYDEIKRKYKLPKLTQLSIPFNGRKETVGICAAVFPGTKVPIYFLKNWKYLSKSEAKDKAIRMGQFAFFDLAVVDLVKHFEKKENWIPSVIHCNDWHTALIPLILKKMKIEIPTLLTIHNLLFQGVRSLKVLELLGIDESDAKELKCGVLASEMNILGEGIVHATRVSTVSPSYAKEIAQTRNVPISPFLARREHEMGENGKVIGILNGIDCNIWGPEKDDCIFHKFNIETWKTGKRDNKEDLLKMLRLEDKPTFCFVGRLAAQKGLDVLLKAINCISHLQVNVIILGSGDARISKSLIEEAKKRPWVKAEIVYSENLAHKIYAGSDFIIVPSRYEPCGLIQMIAMRYGTIPIASDTGGLHDSIQRGKNGFLFKKGKSIRLKKAIEHALNIYKNKEKYEEMVVRAMKTDFSWDKSALKYKKLYQEMISEAKISSSKSQIPNKSE